MTPFITIEGPDGAGKTTLIKGLVSLLKEQLTVPLVLTREPGGEPLAEEIRDIILDPTHTQLDPRAEALLYAASRRQHLMNKVIPALQQGQVVICDRFVDSSVAYQGYGREIGVEGIIAINQFAIEDHMPDLTIYLDLTAEEGIKRIKEQRSNEMNRLDREEIAFHGRVVTGYRVANQKAGDRVVTIDATQTPEAMQQEALNIIKTRFPDIF